MSNNFTIIRRLGHNVDISSCATSHVRVSECVCVCVEGAKCADLQAILMLICGSAGHARVEPSASVVLYNAVLCDAESSSW